MSNLRLCITGGSGFIGTAALQLALDRSLDVINFDIRPPKQLSHQPYWKYVDIRDKSSFQEALNTYSPTHILHLAATTGMDIYDMSFFDANTAGTQNLLDTASSMHGLKRIVFTSSLLVCKNGHVPQLDNEYCPPNLYGESKVIGEKFFRNSSNPFEWVIVRPTSIWGPWFEHSYKTFFRVIDRGLYVQPGNQPITKPLSFVGNTVYMMFQLLFHEGGKVNHQTYYLADYPQHSIQEWADIVRAEIGKSGKTPVFPIGLLRLLGKAGDVLKKVGWSDPPLTSFRLNNMLTGARYPIEKTQSVVGPLPFSIREGVKQTLQWMQQEKLLRSQLKIEN